MNSVLKQDIKTGLRVKDWRADDTDTEQEICVLFTRQCLGLYHEQYYQYSLE